MRKVIVAVIAVLSISTLSWGQFRSQPSSATAEYLRGHEQGLSLNAVKGLLDPARMQMSHSVSFGYANMGGTGVSRGLYMNRLDYQISRPLTLTTHLGYQFQPSGPAEWNPANNGNDFVGGAELNWTPTKNSFLRLSYMRGMMPNRGWGYGGYDYSPWMFPGRP